MIKVVAVDKDTFTVQVTGWEKKQLEEVSQEYDNTLPDMLNWIISEGIRDRFE